MVAVQSGEVGEGVVGRGEGLLQHPLQLSLQLLTRHREPCRGVKCSGGVTVQHSCV